MSKEQLETNKAALELLLSENGDKCIDYKAQIAKIEQELKDLGKLELTESQFDDIYEAVEAGVEEFDWSDENNFEKEFGLDYDNRITLSNLDLCNHQDLVEMIVEKVSELFIEMDAPEEDDAVEKVFTQETGSC